MRPKEEVLPLGVRPLSCCSQVQAETSSHLKRRGKDTREARSTYNVAPDLARIERQIVDHNLYLDNSNVFIEGQRVYAARQRGQ